MAYNTETQEELMTRRLTARQAVPRGWNMPRNMQVVRYAAPPSNDAGLSFESKYVEAAPPPPEPEDPPIPDTQWATHAAADEWMTAWELFHHIIRPAIWSTLTLHEKYKLAKLLPLGED